MRLGPGAFRAITGEVVQPILLIEQHSAPHSEGQLFAIDLSAENDPKKKAKASRRKPLKLLGQIAQRGNPDSRVVLIDLDNTAILASFATAWQGVASSDYARFGRKFWEMSEVSGGWRLQQSTVSTTQFYGGREHMIFWEDGYGSMTEVCQPGAPFRGKEAWGRSGVVVAQMGNLPVTLYSGEIFDNNSAVITVDDEQLLPALWAYCSSDEFTLRVREIDQSLKVTNSSLTKVAFDLDHSR